MQTVLQKFPIKVLFFLFITLQHSFSQGVDEKINFADSLFKVKSYTQAYKVYEDLYRKEGVYTPQMLIKMAFIEEGIGNYPETIFYLHNYYYLTNDKNARDKIEELAEQHNLIGYEYSDMKFIGNLIRFYQLPITFVFVLLISIFVIWIVYRSFRNKVNLKIEASIALILLFGFIALIYSLKSYTPAIIAKTTYVMSGPSPAADIIHTIKKGNKVTVIGEKDVWLEISSNNKTGYIKKNNLLMIKP